MKAVLTHVLEVVVVTVQAVATEQTKHNPSQGWRYKYISYSYINTHCPSIMSLATKRKHQNKRKILELVLTERCNLACVYCYEHNKDTSKMPLDIAKESIISAFNDMDSKELEIDFFGGEPFAAFKDMKNLCEWLWQKEWPKPYIIFVTTNGTLVHGKIKEWVYQNRHRIILGISIDGTPEMHNLNRNNSFNNIDLDFFSSCWPLQTAKMTISPLTIKNLASGVIYLHGRGLKVSCNNAYGVDWNERHYGVFAEQLKKLADFYIQNPNIEPSSIITMPIQNITYSNEPRKWCGAGTNMICIDKSGKRYPCHTFMPSSSGSEVNINEMFDQLNSGNLQDKKCETCILRSCCPTCYGMNYVETSDITKRNDSHCNFSKIRAKATAYMLSEMIIRRELSYSYLNGKTDSEIINFINGIKNVNDINIHM